MWPFKKKLPQRRLEVRRAKPAVPGWWPRFRQAGGVGSSLLAVLLFLAALSLDAMPLDPPGHRPGGYLDRDVYARVRFSVPLRDADAGESPASAPAARRGFRIVEKDTLLARRTTRTGLSTSLPP